MPDHVKIRSSLPEDTNFIISTWLRNYRHSSQFAKDIRTNTFYKWHELVIKRILSRPGTQVTVACDPEHESLIYGYFVVEQQDVLVAHFIYVKKPYRSFGLARMLTESVPFEEYTHKTESVSNKLESKVYNPYRV